MNEKNHPIKVIETKERPQKSNGYMLIMRGIQSKEAAEKWGAHYGFATVYWIKGEEKVYGVRAASSGEQLAVSSKPLAEGQA